MLGKLKALTLAAVLWVPAASRPRLLFQDDFDEPRWNVEFGNRQDATNSNIAVKYQDGLLKISPKTLAGKHFSAVLTTEGIFEFAGGYVEAKVRLKTQSGAWAALWIYNHKASTDSEDIAKNGIEIDIFEHRATDDWNRYLPYVVSHAVHYGGYGKYHVANGAEGWLSDREWNIIGLDWNAGGYSFFINGEKTWHTKDGLSFVPSFLVLSVEIKDKFWAGNIPKGGYSGAAQFEVDWIRVWDKKP